MKEFHGASIAQVLKTLQTNKKNGLSRTEVKVRQKKYGHNALPRTGAHIKRLKIFLDQWRSPLIIILVVAGCMGAVLGEYIDATIILITAFLNTVIGFIQEHKANRALESLQSLVTFEAVVRRDGTDVVLSSSELVPGDIVMISAGSKIQADGRILQCTDLEVSEAPLTGESVPVRKKTSVMKGDVSLGDRMNMVYRGTSVVSGKGMFIVTATGVQTELGQIATLVSTTTDDLTPLQKQLKKLSKSIGIIVIFLAAFVFISGTFLSDAYSSIQLFETAVAVAVAAIPEGLVISLTVILAVGMQHIVKRKALVRKLVAAETLGSVSVICTDKTGTLTKGVMSVTDIVTANQSVNIARLGRDAKDKHLATPRFALEIGVRANDAVLNNPDALPEQWHFFGDTTDVAVLRAGITTDLFTQRLQADERVDDIPFSSNYKYMAVCADHAQGRSIFVKGAPEVLLDRASSLYIRGKVVTLTEEKKKELIKKNEHIAAQGSRIIAVAIKKVESGTERISDEDISGVTFVGFIVLSDPLRADVVSTISIAQKAGIRVVMITGDHIKTAQSISKKLGLPSAKKHVCDGEALEKMSDNELSRRVSSLHVFARVNPEHKIRIVRALQKNKEVVAMTGDGVNDAPAIKGADIGISVGSGTDVAKETSDMVLLDDGFTTIVAAVEEGRGIYQNIKKVVLYLLSGSFAEMVMIVGSIVAGLPVAALPAQILWVNIVEDAFPTMALAFDKGDTENMKDPPRKQSEPLLSKEVKTMIVAKSVLSNIALFGIFVYFLKTTNDITLTRTIVFVGFGIDALFYIFSIRSLRHMIWNIPLFSNKWLFAAVGFGWVMLLVAVYTPPLQLVLRTVPLAAEHWAILVLFGIFNICLIETVKALFIVKKGRVSPA
jgi:P-type Ca2+ transporter type 2C